ncbi:D-alanyl-D-alanine carboxypeptidase [Streptomyces sp. NPDC047000]|uniref:D-alanyl-D-alanine carboxypeptidase n=1 Tax=Streptomyces sp. NPDC047000 TaxID=3155474 RepID=UPI0033F00D29
MEEASVAGESPDSSKQRESSGEPTSGSASPVPEARNEVRDPRLAVAQETVSAPKRGGGVDTATKVFSVRDVRDVRDARDAQGVRNPVTGDEEDSEADGSAGAAPEAASAEAEGTEEAPEPVAADGAGEADDDASDEPADRSGGDDDVRRAAVDSWVVTAEDAAARNGAKAAGAGGDDDAPASGESEGEEKPGAAEEAVDPKADDDAEPAASEDGDTAPEDAKPDDAKPRDTEPEDTAEAPAAAAGDDDAPASDEGEPQDAVPEDIAPESDEPEDAKPEDAKPAAETEGVAEPEDAPKDAAEAEAEDADAAEDEGDPEDKPAPDGKPDPRDKPEPEDTPGPAAPAASAAAPAASAAAPAPAPAVDHPTTVFKAPRPPKPPVDQPTTMLKAPRPTDPKAPPTPKGSATPPAPPAPPAADPERTSRFVALKPLDEPAARPTAGTPTGPAAPAAPAGLAGPAAPAGPGRIAVPPPAERTTQQPLPPKPPLDLLAELTNTPPPPPSPLRTLLRRVKIWTPLVILLVIAFAIVQAVRPLPSPSLALTADDSYTFDGARAALPWPNEGQGWMDVDGIGTMSSFGKQTPVAIGSVAKAMTAYIVLKDHPMKSGADGPGIKVDAKAEKEGGYDKDGESTLNTVKEGDTLTEKDALSAIMIPSANNIARLLARWDAGSEAAFVKKMNATAKELGMTNTTYTDPSGLIETTVSTAEDQVKLGNALVRIPALTDITRLPSWKDPSGQVWQNYNRLVPYNGAIGIKTGTTTKAGGNLLFAATKEVGGETVTLVGAILGQHTAPIIDTVNNVSKTAMLGAQEKLASAKILKKGDVVGYVDDRLGGHTPVVVTKDVTAVGWAGLKVKLSFDAETVPHTAKAGTKVGTLTVGDGGSGGVQVPVALEKDLTEPGFGAKLTRVA